MTPESHALTANSSIGNWLDHPVGGELVRGLLARTGAQQEMLARCWACRCSNWSR